MAEQEKTTNDALLKALESELSSLSAVQPPLNIYDYLTLFLFVVLCVTYICFKKGISIRDVVEGTKFIRAELLSRYNSLRDENGKITLSSVRNNLAESKRQLSEQSSADAISEVSITDKFLITFKISKWYFRIFLASVVVCLYFLLTDFFRF